MYWVKRPDNVNSPQSRQCGVLYASRPFALRPYSINCERVSGTGYTERLIGAKVSFMQLFLARHSSQFCDLRTCLLRGWVRPLKTNICRSM